MTVYLNKKKYALKAKTINKIDFFWGETLDDPTQYHLFKKHPHSTKIESKCGIEYELDENIGFEFIVNKQVALGDEMYEKAINMCPNCKLNKKGR